MAESDLKPLEKSIQCIADIFDNYAGKDGELDDEELANMFEKELSCAEGKAKMNSEKLGKMRRKMKRCKGDKKNFKMYCRAVTCMMMAYHVKKHQMQCEEEDDDE
ncbi:uncharacterized protein ACB058_007492 [Synchiropus picturatus]